MGGYDALLDGGSALETLQVLTGKSAVKGVLKKENQQELLQIFEEAVNNRVALTLTSCAKPNGNGEYIILKDNQKLVYNHIYYLDKVDKNILQLKNPYGKEHLTLNWNVFLQYFIDYAKL